MDDTSAAAQEHAANAESTPEFHAAVRSHLGAAYEGIAGFEALLREHGIERGLVGPRELDRLWERHLLNSAAVVPFIGEGVIADVGSGAGLPGIVVAIMRPEQQVVLVEPMERRVAWLTEVAAALELQNVVVMRGRAEELRSTVSANVVTARAVAAVDKLIKWCSPILAPGGSMALLKGRSAPAEIEAARYALKKANLQARIHEAATLPGLEPTTVVTLS